MRFAFIRDHLVPEFKVKDCCRVLGVSMSGYYRWRRQPVGERQMRITRIAEEIRAIHAESRRNFGAPRIRAALAQRGIHLHVQTVQRIMRSHGIRSRMCRKFRPRTTDSNHRIPPAPDLVRREFRAAGPDRLWLCDITYVPTREGFLYLSTVMDAWSRSIVGWTMRDTLQAEGPIGALRMAIGQRRPRPGMLVHHSDRGVQYACHAYRGLLAAHGIRQSMSHARDCYDNAMAESLFSTLKRELTHHETYATRADARAAVFQWITMYYQRTRLHSALGYLSPAQFEERHRNVG